MKRKTDRKRKRSLVILRAIERVVPPENVQGRLALERFFFPGATARTPEFWRQLRDVAAQVERELRDAAEDAVLLVATDGTGSVCLASGALAMQRIIEKSHVLANSQQVKAYRSAQRKAVAAAAATLD